MNTKELISKCYADVIGQRRIVDNRILAHTAFAMGDNSPCNVLYTGEAGLGKSHLLRAEFDARQLAAEIRFGRSSSVEMYKSPSEFRLQGAAFLGLIHTLKRGDGLIVDELQDASEKPTVQTDKFITAMKQLMDNGQGAVRVARVDSDIIIQRSCEEVFFACGTNYPQRLKDGPAIISRFGGETPLEQYNEEEITTILLLMAKKAGLRVHESSVSILARCGRGTVRPFEAIIGHLTKVARVEGKDTVNRSEVLKTLRDLKLYPNGITSREVAIMVHASGDSGLDISFIPIRFKCEAKAAQLSLAFLAERGYISSKKGVCRVTPRGSTYLENLKADKFEIPHK